MAADDVVLISDAAHPEKFSARQSGVILSGSLLNVIVIEQAAKTGITFHVLGEGRLRWVFEIEGNPVPDALMRTAKVVVPLDLLHRVVKLIFSHEDEIVEGASRFAHKSLGKSVAPR